MEDNIILQNKKINERKDKIKYYFISFVSVSIFILFWYLITEIYPVFSGPALPSPRKVFLSFIYKLTNTIPDNGTIFQHIYASLKVALIGYLLGVIIGIPLGIITAWFKKADLIITPLFDMIRPIPTIAWIPLMIIWIGIGIMAKASIVFMSAFVPLVINTYSGIKQTKNVHLWVASTFGASRMQMLRTIAIPTALPQIFTGLRISLGSAWTALAAAEILASSQGLGFMIQINRSLARPDLIIVGMLVIGIVGALLSLILTYIENKMIKGRN